MANLADEMDPVRAAIAQADAMYQLVLSGQDHVSPEHAELYAIRLLLQQLTESLTEMSKTLGSIKLPFFMGK